MAIPDVTTTTTAQDVFLDGDVVAITSATATTAVTITTITTSSTITKPTTILTRLKKPMVHSH